MSHHKILVVDDDPKIVELIGLYLKREHYRVLTAYDGSDALTKIREREPDLVILDLMLPTISGLDICRIVSLEKKIPIIMLTAKSTEKDILLGLDLGADDYITKPFSPKQLVARTRAVLRRSNGETAHDKVVMRFGPLAIDQIRHEVRLNDELLGLTPREFKLLESMASEPERAFSRLELLERAFGFDYCGLDRTVDAHIMNLRKKMNSAANGEHEFVQTVYGVGYKFVQLHDAQNRSM